MYKININFALMRVVLWLLQETVFEKTWSATQKKRKKSCFLDFEKTLKNVKKTYVVSQAT